MVRLHCAIGHENKFERGEKTTDSNERTVWRFRVASMSTASNCPLIRRFNHFNRSHNPRYISFANGHLFRFRSDTVLTEYIILDHALIFTHSTSHSKQSSNFNETNTIDYAFIAYIKTMQKILPVMERLLKKNFADPFPKNIAFRGFKDATVLFILHFNDYVITEAILALLTQYNVEALLSKSGPISFLWNTKSRNERAHFITPNSSIC